MKRRARRRGNREGSVFKRRDGRWVGQISLGYDRDGRLIRKTVYGKTRQEVHERLLRLQTEFARGELVAEEETLESYLRQWLNHKESRVKPTTHESYRWLIETYVLPALGKHKLQKLSALEVEQLLHRLQAQGLSASTTNYVRRLLFQAFKQAVRWHKVPRNVIEAVDPVRRVKPDLQVWTPEQVERFLAQAAGSRLYGLYYLALTTGMRMGELLALRWEDVDFEASCLRVRYTLAKAEGGYVFAEPKTKHSKRLVDLPEDTLEVLRQHRQRQAGERAEALRQGVWQEHGLVFASTLGSPLNDSNLRRDFKALVKKARVPSIRFHDLRHTHSSLAIRAGVSPKVLSERLGHHSPAFTLEVYTHLYQEQRREAALPLVSLLAPHSKGQAN